MTEMAEVEKTVEKTPDPRDEQIARLDRKILLFRKEMEQYLNDLTFWIKAHGHDYPVRRKRELEKTLEEINEI